MEPRMTVCDERVEPPAPEPLHAFLQKLAGGVDPTGLQVMRMIRVTANLYDAVLPHPLGPSHLSGPRWHVLMRLLQQEERTRGEGLTPTELSECLQVSRNTISALLRGLEEHGMIERDLDQEDRRIFRIRLSAAGRARVQSGAPYFLVYVNHLVAGLTPEEQRELLVLLDKLYASIRAHGEGKAEAIRGAAEAAERLESLQHTAKAKPEERASLAEKTPSVLEDDIAISIDAA